MQRVRVRNQRITDLPAERFLADFQCLFPADLFLEQLQRSEIVERLAHQLFSD